MKTLSSRTMTIALLLGALPALADYASWAKRMPITFAGYGRSETLTDFPALVVLGTNIAGFSYADVQSANGWDLRFSDEAGTTELPYEIESWDANGASYVWVKVPSLAGTNTVIMAYWGNPGAGQQAYTTNGAVWSASDLAVYHMRGTNGAPDCSDFTGNRRNASPHGTANTTGASDGGQAMDGSGYVTGPYNMAGYGVTDRFTAMAWVKPSVWGSSLQCVLSDGQDWQDTFGHIFLLGANTIEFFVRNSGGNYVVNDATVNGTVNQWHMAALKYDSSSSLVEGYFDGDKVWSGSLTGTILSGAYPLWMGRRGDGYYIANGIMDEVRISSSALSSNRIWAIWRNTNPDTHASFNSYGTVLSSVGTPSIANRSATAVTAGGAQLNGYLSGTGTSVTTVFVYWGATDGGTNMSAWAHTNLVSASASVGAFSNTVSLAADSIYFYRFSATNASGQAWAPSSEALLTGALTIDAPASGGSEAGPTSVTFTVHRLLSLTNCALTVNYATAGTAVNGVDYTALSSNVSMAVGASTASIVVTPIDDGRQELDETVTLSLSAGPYGIGTPGAATTTIADAQAADKGNVLARWTDPSPGSGMPNSYEPELSVTPLRVGGTITRLGHTSNGWSPKLFTFDLTVAAGRQAIVTNWSLTAECDNGAMVASLTVTGTVGYALGSTINAAGGYGVHQFTAIDTSPDVTLGPGAYTFYLSMNDGDSGWWASLYTFAVNGMLMSPTPRGTLILLR